MATKKIYLFCTAGMSTSILAQTMQKVAESHDLPLEVKAYPIAKIDEIVEEEHPSCALLGPQVQHQYEATKLHIESTYDVPVGLIDQESYGRIDGEVVLKSAIKLIKTHRKK